MMKLNINKANNPPTGPPRIIHCTTRTRRAAVSHLPTCQMPLALVHPAYRRFFRRAKRCIKRCWNRLSMAIRVRNRSIFYQPLPRVAPFFCQKCRFSSYFAHAIKNHICSKRASIVYSFEREEKIAVSGFRCKSKNALAVMERARNPVAFIMSKPHISVAEPTVPSYNVPPLSVLAFRAINVHRTVVSYPTNLIFESYKTMRWPYPSGVTHRTDVLYCNCCKWLFYEHDAYYEHFEKASCKIPAHEEDIIHIQCRGAESIPAEYEYGRRKCLVTLQSGVAMECTACGISSREFASNGEFHKHLFKCSPIFDHISQNATTRN